MWSFTVLAPGMSAHTTGTADAPAVSTATDSSAPPSTAPSCGGGLLRWAMRGAFEEACSPSAAVAVDSTSPDDEAKQRETAAIVSAGLASPNRLVLQTSTHAFSARATLLKQEGERSHFVGDTPASAPKEGEEDKDSVVVRSCRFLVQQLSRPSAATSAASSSAEEEDPSILVGLSAPYHSEAATAASAETQHQYDTRTLSTPMLWEEPRSFFVDCRRSGLFLWSEDAFEFGRKIADKCLDGPKATNAVHSSSSSSPAVLAQAQIELRWHDGCNATTTRPTISVAVVNGDASATPSSSAPSVFLWALPEGTVVSDLAPSVTFLTEHCRATLLPTV